jgi:Zn-dependent M28 family amino/carboxypeptidase
MLKKDFLSIEKCIIGDIWQNSIIHENMLLIADSFGSRFPGTPSEKKTRDYILKKIKDYGYEKARADPFRYYGWSRGPVKLTMIDPTRREFEAISLAMSPGGDIEGELVNMGTGSPEEFESKNKLDIEGKIVICSSATSPVSLETGTQMLRLSKNKPLKVHIIDKSRVIPETESANIIFELVGNGSKDEWIIVGGHYDGHDISQGAMDNLSATAVIMELARVLKDFDGKFERNIRFILFACEELGVTGSTNYVAQQEEEMKNIAIMINLELGRLANKTGSQHVAFTFYQPDELKEYLEDFAERVGYPMTINKGISAASDHWPFYMKGVPTIYMHAEPTMQEIVQGRGWGHTSADTMDKVDHRNLQEGAMIASRLLLRLANKKDKIATHTPPVEIIKKLEENGMKKILEIENKWHPNSIL